MPGPESLRDILVAAFARDAHALGGPRLAGAAGSVTTFAALMAQAPAA